jgi:hypothetical protein
MPVRFYAVIGLVLVAVGSATQAAVGQCFGIVDSVVQDTKNRNSWPYPFICADRAAVPAPYAVMVANGWRRQNMLGEYHFEPGTAKLTEAGRLKIRWILTVSPQQHRVIYVHRADTDEETSARMASAMQLASKIAPYDLPPVLATSISDEGWPADQIDLVGRKYQASTPAPRLPPPAGGGSSSSSSSSSSGGGTP